MPLEVVLRIDGGDKWKAPLVAHNHPNAFATWAWTSSQPLSYEAVRSALASLPASVFRAKGFLYLAEAPDRRAVAHVVGRRVDSRPLGTWNGELPGTELVFISLDPDVDQIGVRALLAETVTREMTSSSI